MNHSWHGSDADPHMGNFGHDHSGHLDHSVHSAHVGHMHDMDSMNDSGHMHMQMYFHFGYNETILFSIWTISTVQGLIGSVVGIYIIALIYEGLKYFREFLFWKQYSSLQYRTVQGPSAVKSNNSEANNPRVKPSLWSKHHIFQTFLHIIQVFISYQLMLIFMTFNVWLCLPIILGSATGYFLFGWKKAYFVDMTEHCH